MAAQAFELSESSSTSLGEGLSPSPPSVKPHLTFKKWFHSTAASPRLTAWWVQFEREFVCLAQTNRPMQTPRAYLQIYVILTTLLFALLLSVSAQAQSEEPPKLMVPPHKFGNLKNVEWSPDGSKISTVEFNDGEVLVWDVATGMLLRRLPHPEVEGAGWSNDSTRLATTSYSRSVIWNVENGIALQESDFGVQWPGVGAQTGPMRIQVRWAPNNSVVLFTGILSSCLWALESDEVFKYAGPEMLTAVEPDKNWARLAGAYRGDTLVLLDFEAKGVRTIGKVGDTKTGTLITSLRWSPDGRSLAVVDSAGWVHVWSEAGGIRVLGRLPLQDESETEVRIARDLGWKDDGDTVAALTREDGDGILFPLEVGQPLTKLPADRCYFDNNGVVRELDAPVDGRVRPGPLGQYLAVVSNGLTILDAESGRPHRTLASSRPEGRELVTVTNSGFGFVLDGSAYVFKNDGGEFTIDGVLSIDSWESSFLERADWGSRIAVTRSDGRKAIVDGDTGRILCHWTQDTFERVSSWNTKATQFITYDEDSSYRVRNARTGDVISIHSDFISFGLDDEVETLEPRSDDEQEALLQTIVNLVKERESPNGSLIARVIDRYTFEILSASSKQKIRTIRHPGGDFQFPPAWNPSGDKLAHHNKLEDQICIWEATSGRLLRSIPNEEIVHFDWNGDDFLIGWAKTYLVVLEVDTGEVLVEVRRLGEEDWVATTPEGFFDGSPEGLKSLHWVFGMEPLSLEAFFAEFYQPGLLADVLASRRPISEVLLERGDDRGTLNIANKDRRQPLIRLSAPESSQERLVEVTLELVENREQPQERPAGIRDVRLFLNDTLVESWEGPQLPGTLTSSVELLSGKNVLKAYAFNDSNVKSEDAEVTVEGYFPKQVSKSYVLTVGVDNYRGRPDLQLKAAVNDAEMLAAAMVEHLPVDQVGEVYVLKNGEATKAKVLSTLKQIAAQAAPQDTIIVAFAGHGFLSSSEEVEGQNQFYLLAHDSAESESSRTESLCISESELERAFLEIKAQNIALILDTCHSGAALDSPEWRRGPMNSRGLAQLAWEKGMVVITASQSYGLAREVGAHGLLTAALLQGFGQAEREANGELLAKTWLEYAGQAVPALSDGDQVTGSYTARVFTLHQEPRGFQLQRPRVFHRRGNDNNWAVSRP